MSKNGTDEYIKMSCPNCESEYAVEFYSENTDGEPTHCPFCGEEIPEVDEDCDGESEDEAWSSPWE